MRSVKRSNSGYVFEPIVTVSGGMLGFELVKKREKNEHQFNTKEHRDAVPEEDRIKAFFDQVTIACVNEDVFINHSFLLSIVIDYDIALHIISNTAIRKVLQQHSYIRLTLDEHFKEFEIEEERAVLHALTKYCTLWLDRFGEGSTSLSLVMNEKFEYIKISESFFWQHQGTLSFRKIIEYLRPYCNGVIICGVEHYSHIEYLKGSDIQAMQGALWWSYNQEKIIQYFS
ncbi:EAL domain-containing protein [Hafnia psychrotolerans]|uniref:Diguanylate phosphodiesterase n=1 Tax=Hafnia psychrotolerans TaxID=1477018 RepID=A0ABQ1GNU6_9GAMM|nr:EAL domain-containing protein [Hafnia psychrotolerans]GGA47392.1 diguanylate phosphodiesterase [Hafnia psychrotolerans]